MCRRITEEARERARFPYSSTCPYLSHDGALPKTPYISSAPCCGHSCSNIAYEQQAAVYIVYILQAVQRGVLPYHSSENLISMRSHLMMLMMKADIAQMKEPHVV